MEALRPIPDTGRELLSVELFHCSGSQTDTKYQGCYRGLCNPIYNAILRVTAASQGTLLCPAGQGMEDDTHTQHISRQRAALATFILSFCNWTENALGLQQSSASSPQHCPSNNFLKCNPKKPMKPFAFSF